MHCSAFACHSLLYSEDVKKEEKKKKKRVVVTVGRLRSLHTLSPFSLLLSKSWKDIKRSQHLSFSSSLHQSSLFLSLPCEPSLFFFSLYPSHKLIPTITIRPIIALSRKRNPLTPAKDFASLLSTLFVSFFHTFLNPYLFTTFQLSLPPRLLASFVEKKCHLPGSFWTALRRSQTWI